MDPESNLLLEKISDPYIFSNISIINYIFNILIGIFLSLLIAYTYTKYGKNISNRKEFSENFTLLTLTTMFIITIVKSSLALSLGLVGALSIVRFRSAIKDPEELTYLFLNIAIGLGLGANQPLVTIITTIVAIFFIIMRSKLNKKSNYEFINLIINSPKNKKHNIDNIIKTLVEFSNKLNLRRYTEDDDFHELCFFLNIESFSKTQLLINKLSKNFPGISIDLIDKDQTE